MIKCLMHYLVRPGDSPEDAQIKRTVSPVAMLFGLFCMGVAVVHLRGSKLMAALGAAVAGVSGLGFSVGALLDLFPTRFMLDALLLGNLVGVVLLDMENAAVSATFRALGMTIILLDVALVFNRDHIPYIVLPVALCWLAAECVESMHRYGVYEAGYWGIDVTASYCNCPSPPCSRSVTDAFLNTFIPGWLLLMDFYFTRGFSSGMRLQLRRVRSSIDVAVEIAAALARYDVDVAETAIAKGTDLPEELAVSFRQLLSNLRSYKAYLPHSCLVPQNNVENEEGESSGPQPARVRTPARSSGPQPAREDNAGETASLSTPPRTLCSSSSLSDSGLALSSTIRSEPKSSSFVNLRAPIRRARVSLAVGNMIGYLPSSDLAGESHSEWMASDVEWWCTAVTHARGVVDLIGGDRRYASFNARQ
eukprot:Hpha_TRINITY_DN16274_c5_g3::TRINITY_DN16274_c5_g3_i1::g.15823::m.15823